MRIILIAVFFMIFCMEAGICFGADVSMQDAWTYYLKGNYDKTLDICRSISRNKMLGEEGHYIMGLSFLKLNDPAEARDNFTFVLDHYPNTKIKDKLILGIADSYFIEKKYESAEENYKRLLGNFPRTPYASIAYLRLGESQQRLGKWQMFKSSLRKLIRDYPRSLEAEEAKRLLKKRSTFFSVQVGAFSRDQNAQKYALLFKRRGYDAFVKKTIKNDKLLYCVKVGKFDTKQKAHALAAELKRKGYSVRVTP